MITRFSKRHERGFLELVESMWRDKETYNEVSYEYLDRYWYQDRFYDSGFMFFISENSNGRVNGFIIAEVYQTEVEVVFLFVTPQYRRMNIGSCLKRQIIKQAQLLGKKEVTAYNLHSNERSLGMNNKIGLAFCLAGGSVKHYIDNIDEYYYRSVYVLNKPDIEDEYSVNTQDIWSMKDDKGEWMCDCTGCQERRLQEEDQHIIDIHE